ncbi:ABC transporter permease [Phenylobacterium sp.]|uniref:ABC transporter permease n=1 Tax=Phenylobacterium sp. TaxID=1871053 RepID=UPI002F9274CC
MSSAYTHLTGHRGHLAEARAALDDVRRALGRSGLAVSLAWHDIVARYRGSILGPLWITLSMAAMVAGIGLLYAQLFRLSLAEYVPFLALGIVIWGMISTTIVESCDTFTHAAGMLRQTSLPLLIFPVRTVLRNLINLAHHVVIVVVVLALFTPWREIDLAAALLGLALVVVNLVWVTTVVGIVAARFRDIPQIVAAVVQFAMFMTPVFWRPEAIPERHLVLTLNPFHYMIAAVRRPLLGEPGEPGAYAILAALALAGWALAFGLYVITRRRIVHYL